MMPGFIAARVVAWPLLLTLVVAVNPPVRGEGIAAVRQAAEEIRLQSDASRPGGMEMATLAGNMGKPGLYAARIRIPAGLRVLPHTHPEDRLVVVLSGTLLVGYGGHFDASLMKALPPGGFFTEPAGQPHFAWARDDDVIVQVSGIGPSGTVYVDPGHAGD
jgi:quercetin dioxygenase-like cupin family protein